MNRLSLEKRANIIAHLAEGCSIRSTARITGADKNTVMWLGAAYGDSANTLQRKLLTNLKCSRIEADETWSYVYAKEKNVPADKRDGRLGDCYTWVAIDPDTKLVPVWHVGKREYADAGIFINDLYSRLNGRIQLSTDGFQVYPEVIGKAFGHEVDYGWLIKNFGQAIEQVDSRYSPPKLKGSRGSKLIGNPDPSHISTSIVERQNLTIRMCLRRCTRLTNAFSKKFENHESALALHFLCYNFVRIHSTIRVTPAMEAGITDQVWSYEDVAKLLDCDDSARK